jgi:hypothetical protein
VSGERDLTLVVRRCGTSNHAASTLWAPPIEHDPGEVEVGPSLLSGVGGKCAVSSGLMAPPLALHAFESVPARGTPPELPSPD